MNIKRVRIEYQENPIGMDVEKPRFSWVMESSEENCLQKAYRIQVNEIVCCLVDKWDNRQGLYHSYQPDSTLGKNDCVITNVWDSKQIECDTSVLVAYEGEKLKPETTYQVVIHVWNNHGEEGTETATFETGLLQPEKMNAKWISSGFEDTVTACPVFTKVVETKKKIQRVRIYATAHGIYEISINGKKVGDAYFAPGWTSYHHRLQYQTYDVTAMFDTINQIEFTVADGWYKGPFGFTLRKNIYGDKVAVLAEIHISYEDGSEEIVCTDESWKVTTGAIRESQIYFGETIDSTCKDEEMNSVVVLDETKENLVAQEGNLVRITKKTAAKNFIVSPKQEHILDFGQNMSGFVEVHMKGERGQKITVYHAETLDRDGNFYPDTLRQATSIDTYICDGTDQIFTPHFTFHGFRYIRIEGVEKENIKLSNFIACTIHSDMEETGTFRCSNPFVNQLQSNIEWGMRSNFLDIPTDCPQRDERLGWTGDAQIFAATASYHMDTALFFEKWLRDMKAEQTKEWGVPHVVPNILGNQAGAAAWSDAATIIPWVIYETYGDKGVLEEQFDSMKGWVDYITEHCSENGLWQTGYQYGDWLALDKEESADRTGATDKYLVANAYYAHSCQIVWKAAKVLGRQAEVAYYASLYEKIVSAFQEEYITKTGRIVSETQTGCVLALHFQLADKTHRERILKSLVTNIENHKNHLSTGFVGTPYICHTLSEHGEHDLAGTIFLQEDYPSWLYGVKKGATTIWERWNSILPNGNFDESGMNSLNHYAYGSIGEWMYKKLAGINLVEAGYKKFYIKPMFMKGITWVDATFESVYGTIRSAWKCENNRIVIDLTIPANTTADIHLPEKEERITLGSGTYHYEYETQIKLEKERFTMDSTLQQILEEPRAVEMFNQMVPGMLEGPMIKFAYQMTMAEMVGVAPEAKPLYQAVIDALNRQESVLAKEIV